MCGLQSVGYSDLVVPGGLGPFGSLEYFTCGLSDIVSLSLSLPLPIDLFSGGTNVTGPQCVVYSTGL